MINFALPHGEAVKVAAALSKFSSQESRKRPRPGSLMDVLRNSRAALANQRVDQICEILGFSSQSSFILIDTAMKSSSFFEAPQASIPRFFLRSERFNSPIGRRTGANSERVN